MYAKPFQEFVNQDYNSLSSWLFSLSSYEFSLIAAAIGFAIAPALTINQQNSLGNFLELIGKVILTINAQNVTLKQVRVKESNIAPYPEEEEIDEEILKIKREVIQLRKDLLLNDK